MLQAIRKTARKLVRDFGEVENLQVSRKGPKDFVSAADLRAEKTLIDELQKARPDYAILSEEAGALGNSGAEYRWIIDPLDGTVNFLHGFSMFCITVALEKRGPGGRSEIVAAVTDAPILKETFWAEKGRGAWLETAERMGSMRLRIGSRKKLAESLLCIGSYKSDLKDGSIPESEFAATRCIGSTALALAYLAAGRYDCVIHSNAKQWDIAAGILLVKEAGGTVTDASGGNKMFEQKQVLATNEDIHRLLFRKV